MEIKNHSLKLTGKADLPNELGIDQNYTVTLTGTIVSSSDHSNQDGTVDRTYVFKPVLVELIDEKGQSIKAKDTRKMSQLLRGILRREWQDCGEDIGEEEYYEREMKGIMAERMNRN